MVYSSKVNYYTLNFMLKIIACAGIFLFSNHAFGLDIKQALEKAYETNPAIKAIQNKFLGNIQDLSIAKSLLKPRISANISFGHGKYYKKYDSDTSHNFIGSSKINQQNIGISQIIYKYGIIDNIRASEIAAKASIANFYKSEQEFLFRAIQVYFYYITYREIYSICDVSVQKGIQKLRSEQEKFKLGESTKTNVAEAKSSLASSKTQKINIFATLAKIEAEFINIFGVKPESIMSKNNIDNLPNNLGEFLAKVNEGNFDIIESKLIRDATKFTSHAAIGELMPSANISANISKSYEKASDKNPFLELYNSIPDSLKEYKKHKIELGIMAKSIENNRIKDKYVNNKHFQSTININIPILPNGGAEYAKIRKSKANYRVAHADYLIKKTSLKSSAIGLWEEYQSSKMLLENLKEKLDAAQIAYEGVKMEESVGHKTLLQVLEHEDSLTNVKIEVVKSKLTHIINSYNLIKETGELTAKGLKLNVKMFEPKKELRKLNFINILF